MNIIQIEQNIQSIVLTLNVETFIYEFLTAFGTPNATIKKLQIGSLNLSKNENEILWKKKIYFTHINSDSLHSFIDRIRKDETINKQQPRFIIIINDKSLVAYDNKTEDSLDCELGDLPKHFSFFLPLAGMEKAQHQVENPADVKASEKMAKLYDEIRKDNDFDTEEEVHGLNVFLSRLLFCFFAEDTGIFAQSQFTHSISNHTQTDGSDLGTYLDRVFQVMNTTTETRGNIPQYLNDFPYVNGGLFKDFHKAPQFTKRSRLAILECGELSWSAINPDIFGSMIQAVITPEHRGGMGMHYTSVPNIMKVIEPLFLNELFDTFDYSKGNVKKLNDLLRRLWNIKIFDPACGSGNFLIISYKELRKLEMLIFEEIDKISGTYTNQFSGISLNNFFGIELDDFAHEVAILSLWLAEHQMNVEFTKQFGRSQPSLPLKQTGNIVQGNACHIDWEMVCPKKDGDEIYILGNPPYLGSRNQNNEQKKDMAHTFQGVEDYKKLDYISSWFYLGSTYIKDFNSKYAFVTTNSITQGEQVPLIWPLIFNKNQEIYFAHQSFKWTNSAKDNAAVAVVIIGVRNINDSIKTLYGQNISQVVKNISPYLTNSSNIFVHPRNTSLSSFPIMITGSAPCDDGNLILEQNEKDNLVFETPSIEILFKKYVGAQELINKTFRYCLYVKNDSLNEAYKHKDIVERFEKVRQFRIQSKKVATKKKSETPYLFDEDRYQKSDFILVPKVGSERREYLPLGFYDESFLPSNTTKVIYEASIWLFGILSSKMQILWVKAVAGRLKTDMQYSNTLCYNTFPFPKITDNQKEEIQQFAYKIIEEREKHSEKTLSQLYDPDKMPEGLRVAHRQNDLVVERCYRLKPFESDEERLEYLFKLYEQMIAKEKGQETLF